MSDQTTLSCQICGCANPKGAKHCMACGFSLADEPSGGKVDAILEDLMDLSKASPAKLSPPPAEEPREADEAEADKLLDSLRVEVDPSSTDEALEVRSPARSAEIPRPSPESLRDVERIPVLATPAETEGRKLLRISGRMFDTVTSLSVGALFAVFVLFRMYESPFDPSRPLPILVFGAVALSGMTAALSLYHVSTSEVAQGDRLVKQGRHQEALAHYERAIRIVRRPSYAWTSRGVAMRYLGRLDEALRCHENAIRLDSENEVAWCNLGTVYFKQGQLGKALDCYDKAIKIRPRYAIAWNNKGVVYARMNRFQDADQCHAKATRLRPEYVAAWLNRGEVLARLGARREAEQCLQKARALGA